MSRMRILAIVGVTLTFVILSNIVHAGQISIAASEAHSITTTTNQIPAVTIKAVEYSFDAPQTIEAGLNALTFENEGKQKHNLKVWRLKDGRTLDDTSAGQSRKALRALVEPYGGTGPTDPGGNQQLIPNLAERENIHVRTTSGSD